MQRLNREALRKRVIRTLRLQGFRIREGTISPPLNLSKDRIRELHETAVRHKLSRARPTLWPLEDELLGHIASRGEVDPNSIRPRLVEVRRDSEEELLFRYCALHWSIPVSSGYGRRLRFLVLDEQNDKIIGILGLADPVFGLAARDKWIGWDPRLREERLQYVMDAFALGAVPPYSFLLCGKLVALLVASKEVRTSFAKKYGGTKTRIKRRLLDGRLALVTTSSALGRSSIYNRLTVNGRKLFNSVGYTRGSGEFHFANGLYDDLKKYVTRYSEPSARRAQWGEGFRNRREVVKKCLPLLGISCEWVYHGIQREVFGVPLARNSLEFLRGEHNRLRWYGESTVDLFQSFRERWLIPRAATDPRYRDWDKEAWRIWPHIRKGNG